MSNEPVGALRPSDGLVKSSGCAVRNAGGRHERGELRALRTATPSTR